MRAYEYRHVVGFEETNLVGNVYYVNHLRWQGRCRELFLRDHAPNTLAKLSQGLSLVTMACSCEYFGELFALDEVVIRMRLEGLTESRMRMAFDYYRCAPGDGNEAELVARGRQEIACVERRGDQAVPASIPDELRQALEPYMNDGQHSVSND